MNSGLKYGHPRSCSMMRTVRLPSAARRCRSHSLLFSFRRLSLVPNTPPATNRKTSLAALFRKPSPSSSPSKTTPNRHADNEHTDLPFIEWCKRCDLFTLEIRRLTRRNPHRGQCPAFFGPAIFSGLLKKNVISKDAADVLADMVESGVFPQEDFLLWKLIDKVCRSGHVGKAWDFVHALKKGGGLVDTSCCNALLNGLNKIRDFEKMNLLFSEMKDWVVAPDELTYSILLDHLCKSNRVDHAVKMLEDLSVRNQSNAVLFNSVINGLCKSGRLEDGLKLLESMKSKSGCSPTSASYNCLIDGYCKAGDIDTANHLLKRMKDENVPYNIITMNALIDGLCRSGRAGSALEFFRQQQSADSFFSGNVITYSTLITGFLKAGNVDKAVLLHEEMLRSGHKPDALSYYVMISGFAQAGRVDDALSMATQMQKDGFNLDVVSYNYLISGFAKKKRPDKMRMLFHEMIKDGVKPDTVTYSTLISSSCKAGNISAAKKLLEEMVDSGNKPNIVTYGALIHGYCKTRKFDEAREMFRRMTETGTKPDNVIYSILIISLCKQDQIDDALSLLDEMRVQGLMPKASTYNAVFACLCRRNSLAKAFEIMKEMKEQGCQPNLTTLNILADWFSEVGEIAKLKGFIHDDAFAELIDLQRKKTQVNNRGAQLLNLID